MQVLLAMRETNSGGAYDTTRVIITNDHTLPEDKLLVNAKLKKMTRSDCPGGLEFLAKISYAAMNVYVRKKGVFPDNFREAMKSKINQLLLISSPDDRFERMINNIDVDHLVNELMKLVCDGSPVLGMILTVYDDSVNEKSQNSAANLNLEDIFVRRFSESKSQFQELINKFWEEVLIYLNNDYEKWKRELAEYIFDEKASQFVVYLGEEDKDSEFANLILKNCRKSYLFREITLMFRSKPSWFYKTRTETSMGSPVSPIDSIQFVDARPLFYFDNDNAYSEVDRTLDLFSQYHCDQMVIVIDPTTYGNTTHDDIVCKRLFSRLNRQVIAHIVFTNLDRHLCEFKPKSFSEQSEDGQSQTDWEECCKKSCDAQKQIVDSLEYVKSSFGRAAHNTGDEAVLINVPIMAADFDNADNILRNILKEKGIVDYAYATDALLNEIADYITIDLQSFKVLPGIKEHIYFDFSGCEVKGISNLRNRIEWEKNRFTKDKWLHSNTEDAFFRHWCDHGMMFTSRSNSDFSSFSVKLICELAMQYIDYIKVDAEYVCGDSGSFKRDLKKDLKEDNNYFGRIVASIIGKEACDYVLDRFMKLHPNAGDAEVSYEEMMEYITTNYFPSNQFSVNNSEKFKNVMNKALAICVKRFIDLNCTQDSGEAYI